MLKSLSLPQGKEIARSTEQLGLASRFGREAISNWTPRNKKADPKARFLFLSN
jgi:hypothetical protein